MRRAFEWIYVNAGELGADPTALSGYGATAGPPSFIRAATLISGSYFMEPVVLSTRGSYVQLSPREVPELSPGLFPERLQCPALIAYAEHDTDEFQRQSGEYATRLKRSGLLQGLVRFPHLNHFELVEKLAEPTHPLVAAIARQMGITPAEPVR